MKINFRNLQKKFKFKFTFKFVGKNYLKSIFFIF